jgi:hypothetical protein
VSRRKARETFAACTGIFLVAGLLIAGFWNVSAGAAPAVRWLSITEPSFEVNSQLQVADTATIKQKGMAVDWQVRFQCPKGEKYTITGANLGNLNPPNPPQLQDGDRWIYASLRKDVTGTCTGKWQTANLHLYTVETTWPDMWWQDVFYPAGSCWCPVTPEVNAETNVEIYGDGFYALYAVNVGAYTSAQEQVDLIER